MPDREKVIKLFSSCISKGGWNNCTNCEHGKAQAVLTCKPLAEDVLKVLEEQNTVDHALEVLRQAGWKETQDVPFPAELLKEQEAVEPKTEPSAKGYWYTCGVCGWWLFEVRDTVHFDDRKRIHFCASCGRAVKWDV